MQRAKCRCSRKLGSVSRHRPLSKATIPHCRHTHLAKIKKGATRPGILPSAISPPPWWVTSYYLLVLIYQVMSLQTTPFSPMLSFIDTLLRVEAQDTTFFRHFFIKAWFCWGEMCLFWHITSVGGLDIIKHHTPSIICDFSLPVDFSLDVLFPRIFWFLHQNWVGTGLFTLTELKSVGDKVQRRSPMIAPPVLPQSAFCTLKTTDWPRLDRFKFLVWYILNALRVSVQLQLESQSEPMG